MSEHLKISDDLKLPLEAVTQTFAILAKRGVGKTYTGCVLVEEMLGAGQQVVVADPIGVWWGLRSSADGRSAGFAIVVFGGEHADVPLEEHSGEVIAGAIVEHGFSAILDLCLLRKAAQVRFMTAFAETLYRLNRKPLHFAVDEADAFAPQRPMKGEERLLGSFEDIVRRGRARGLGVTLITQRAAVINKNVLTQIEVLVCLRTISPQDREAIEAWIEVHGTEKQRDAMLADLPSLPVGTAYFWSPGWLDIFQKVKVRKRTTFDSSSTPKVGEKVIAPKHVAAVDLAALGSQISETAAKAKENDPGELKRQLAAARKELVAALNKASPATKETIKEVATFTAADATKLLRVEKKLDEVKQMFECGMAKLPVIEDLISKLSKPSAVASAATHRVALRPVTIRHSTTPPLHHSSAATNGELSGGLKRMMIALAQRPGLTKRQLGVRAGLSSSSGTFGTYLGRLRSLGYVTGSENIGLTNEGLEALGNYTPLPEGQDLLNYWLNELGSGGAGRMLSVLADSYPQALNKELLGERAQISPTSGTFGTYLGKLRTLELIEGRGELRAAKEFFE